MKNSDDKITIGELSLHYINKYKLDESSKDTIYKSICRILQKTKLNEESLWNAIEESKGLHKITIEEFQNKCFVKFGERLKKYMGNKYNKKLKWNKRQLDKDIEFYIGRKTDEEYKNLANDANKEKRELLESGKLDLDMKDYLNSSLGDPFLSNEEVEKKKEKMMLEAIFNIFYEPFKIEEFTDDNKTVFYSSMDDITGEYIKAEERLKDFRNYCKKRELDINKKRN